VVALGDIRGPTGGIRVRRGGGREVAAELVQVAADGVPPVPVAEHLAQPVGPVQSATSRRDVIRPSSNDPVRQGSSSTSRAQRLSSLGPDTGETP